MGNRHHTPGAWLGCLLTSFLLLLGGCGDDSTPGGGSRDGAIDGRMGAPDSGRPDASGGGSDSGGDGDSGPGSPDGGSDTDAGTDSGPAPMVPCGMPDFPDGTALRRSPYLQSTTTSSVRIAWTTTSGGAGSVEWAPGGDGPWTRVAATAEMFSRSRTGESTDFTAHDATPSGLDPDRDYCYRVLDGDAIVAGGLSFHTAWSGTPHPLRILAFGDSGDGGRNQRALRDVMLTHQFDVFLHLGDIAYDNGTFSEFESNAFGVYRDIMDVIPTFPAIGNHEYNTANGQPYVDVYYLFEQALREEHQERYYSFDYGNVHFSVLDSNPEMLGTISASAADDMADWLRDDLMRSSAPWKIVLCHHPFYSSGDHGSTSALQRQIMPILEETGVDLVLVGHDHDYERTVPILAGAEAASDPRAIVYVVAGAGGAGLYSVSGDWFTAASNDSTHSFLSFTVDGCNGHGEAIAQDGSTLDTFDVAGCE